MRKGEWVTMDAAASSEDCPNHATSTSFSSIMLALNTTLAEEGRVALTEAVHESGSYSKGGCWMDLTSFIYPVAKPERCLLAALAAIFSQFFSISILSHSHLDV